MLMSSSTRSGSSLAKERIALVPSPARTTRYPACDSVNAISASKSMSSSAHRIFIGVSLAGHPQLHFETRLSGRCAPRRNRSAVTLDDRFDDPQSQSQSAGLGLFAGAARETLENRALFQVRSSRPFVFDPGRHLIPFVRGADAHHAVLGRELARVRA